MSSAHAVWYGTLVVQSLLVIGSERRDDVTNLRVLEVLAAVGLRVVQVGRRWRAVEWRQHCGDDDARDEEGDAPAETEPEAVLKHHTRTVCTHMHAHMCSEKCIIASLVHVVSVFEVNFSVYTC